MASYRDDPTADGVTVNLSSREAIDGWGGHDDLHSIENVTGSDGDDLITGNSGRNRLLGLRGDDDIRGHGGGDTLAGHRGSDFLSGNKGNDRLDGNNGTDTLFGGNGEDKLSGGAHNDLLNGGTGNDALWGGWGADRFVYDSETGDSDRIRDFQNNIDTIAIDVADGTTIDDVIALASEVGDDVQIDFGDGNVLTIEDAKISHLPNDIVLL
nr:calcium-binding protein [Rhodobium orientis]